MRNRHNTQRNVTEAAPDEETNPGPAIAQRLPWENIVEHEKFMFSLMAPGHSIRKAYKAYCEAHGIEPKENPPSSWYQLAKGEYAAIRRADWQDKAIRHAGEVHNRFPDWERLEMIIEQEGELEQYKGGEFYEVMLNLTLIDFAFHSLAIDSKGDPLPGVPTWIERSAAYWEAVERGEVAAPEG